MTSGTDRGSETYLTLRDAWIRRRAPHLIGSEPVHTLLVSTPIGNVSLEELDPDGTMCGIYRSEGQHSVFGSTQEVLAAATDLPLDHPWVIEVTGALDRERRWKAWGSGWGRRNLLEVHQGRGEMFHVSASANRDSILQHGLDWNRMRIANGVAGSRTPELPGIFLQESADDDFFVRMARFPTDVWSVSVDNLWIESGPSGWWLVARPISPERLVLLPAHYRAGE